MIMKQLFRYASTLLRSALLLGAMAFVNTQTTAQNAEQWAEMPDAFETMDPATIIGDGNYYYIQFYSSDHTKCSYLTDCGANQKALTKDFLPYAYNRLWTLEAAGETNQFKLRDKAGRYLCFGSYGSQQRVICVNDAASASILTFNSLGNGYYDISAANASDYPMFRNGTWDGSKHIGNEWDELPYNVTRRGSYSNSTRLRFAKLKSTAAFIIYYRGEEDGAAGNSLAADAATTRHYLTYSGTTDNSNANWRESNVSSRQSIIPSDKPLCTLPTLAAYHQDGLWTLEGTGKDGEFFIKKYGTEEYLNPVKYGSDWFYCSDLGTKDEINGKYVLQNPLANRYTLVRNKMYSEVALTSTDFNIWNGYDASATSTGTASVGFNVGTSLGAGTTVVGTDGVLYLTYANLTGYTKMLIKGDENMQVRVLMNRQESDNGYWVERNATIGSDGTAVVDLTGSNVGKATVNMTYVNKNTPDTPYGDVTTAYCGFNKISMDGTVNLAMESYGVNNIAYLKVDASAISGTIRKVTLVGDFQQINERELEYGVGYNSSTWSLDMTWNTADRSITTLGGTQPVTKATADKELSFDITGAFTDSKVKTILVYNTVAGAGYIKNARVYVEYEPDDVSIRYVHLNAIKTGWGSPSGTISSITMLNEDNENISSPRYLDHAIDDGWQVLQWDWNTGDTNNDWWYAGFYPVEVPVPNKDNFYQVLVKWSASGEDRMINHNGGYTTPFPTNEADYDLWQLEMIDDYLHYRLKAPNGQYLKPGGTGMTDPNDPTGAEVNPNSKFYTDFSLTWFYVDPNAVPKEIDVVKNYMVTHKKSYLQQYAQAGLDKQGLATDADDDWWNYDKGIQKTNHFEITHYVKKGNTITVEFPTVLNRNNDHIFYQRFYNYDEADETNMDLDNLKAHVSLDTRDDGNVQYFLYKNGMVTGQKLIWKYNNGTDIPDGGYARNVQRRFNFTNSDGNAFTVAADVSRYSDIKYWNTEAHLNGDLEEPSLTMRYLYYMKDAKVMATSLSSYTEISGVTTDATTTWKETFSGDDGDFIDDDNWYENKEFHFPAKPVAYENDKWVGYRGEFIGLRHVFSDYWVFDGAGTDDDNLVSAVNNANEGKIEVRIYDPHNTGIKLGGWNPTLAAAHDGTLKFVDNNLYSNDIENDFRGFYFYDKMAPSIKTSYGDSRFVVFRYPSNSTTGEVVGVADEKTGEANKAYIHVYLNNNGTRYQLAQYTLIFDKGAETLPYTSVNGSSYVKDDGTAHQYSDRDPNKLREVAGKPIAKITFDYPLGKTYHYPLNSVTRHDGGDQTVDADGLLHYWEKEGDVWVEKTRAGIIDNSSPVPLIFDNTNYAFDGDGCNWGSYALVAQKSTIWGNGKLVKPADAAKTDGGYGIAPDAGLQRGFLYIDASEQPGDICSADFQGEFCAGDKLMCSGWISGSNKVGDFRCPGGITLTVKGERIEDGVKETIYRFCPGQCYELDNGTSNADGSDGTQVVWQQFYFEFGTTKKYKRYWMEVNNNCVSSNGGDFMLDNIEVYAFIPEVIPEMNTPLCINKDVSEMQLLKINIGFDKIIKASNSTEVTGTGAGEDKQIAFVFLEKEKFLNLFLEELNKAPLSLGIANVEELVKIIERGDLGDKITPSQPNYLNAYKNAFDQAVLGDDTKVWDSNSPNNNTEAAVLNFHWNTNFSKMETYSFAKAVNRLGAVFRETDPESGERKIVMNGNYPNKLDWKINTDYYVIPYNVGVTSITTALYEDFNICSACCKKTEFQIEPSIQILSMESSDVTQELEVCEGKIPTLLTNLTGYNINGELVPLKDINFDWWLGDDTKTYPENLATLTNYHKAKNYDGIRLDEALSILRAYYPDITSLVGIAENLSKTPGLTKDMVDYLQYLVDNGQLILHQKSISIPAERAATDDPYFYLVACPIHDGYFDKALNPAANKFVSYFCDEPQGLRMKVGEKAPALKCGFVPGENGYDSYNYPVDSNPVLSIRLAKKEQFENVQHGSTNDGAIEDPMTADTDLHFLWVPIRDAVVQSTGSTAVIQKSTDYNIYLASTDDPVWDEEISKKMNTVGELPIFGKIVQLNAINTSGGTNVDAQKDQNRLCIYFINYGTTDEEKAKYAVREGYTYTLSLPFRENGNGNACDGNILLNVKIVPDYEVWTGAADNSDWNNDQNWRRADGNLTDPDMNAIDGSGQSSNELYVSSSLSDDSKLKNYKSNYENYRTPLDRILRRGFAPLYCTHVLFKSDEWGNAPKLYDALDGMTGPLGDDPEPIGPILSEPPFPNLRNTSTPILKFDMQARLFDIWTETYADAPDKGRTGDLLAEMYQINSCDEIAFQPGTELVNAHLLNYNNAWVEYQLDNKRWYLLGSSLQGTISGEWYAPTGTAQQKTTYYEPVKFGAGYDRYSPAIYQRSWDKAKAVLYEVGATYSTGDNPDDLALSEGQLPGYTQQGRWDVNADQNVIWNITGADEYLDRLGYKPMGDNKVNVAMKGIWSNTYNDATVDYTKGGFSVMVMNHLRNNDTSGGKAIIRLPKEDTMYDYYEFGKDGSTDGGTDTSLEDLRGDALKRNLNRGRLKTDLLMPQYTRRNETGGKYNKLASDATDPIVYGYGNRSITRVPTKLDAPGLAEADKKGLPLTLQTINESVSAGISNMGYYLVENPFQCGMDMSVFFDTNPGLERKYWLLTANGQHLVQQSKDGDWIEQVPDPDELGNPNPRLLWSYPSITTLREMAMTPPGQGFFVKAKTAGEGTSITFNEKMQEQSRIGEKDGTGKTYTIVVGTQQKMTTKEETITLDDGSTQKVTVEVPEVDADGNYVIEDITDQVIVYNYIQSTTEGTQFPLQARTRAEGIVSSPLGLVITAKRGESRSSALVMQYDKASNDFLPEEDTEVFINSDLEQVPTVYTLCGRLATTINSIHDFRSLPLGVESNSNAPCTLTFQGVETLGDSISFYDAVEQKLTPLESGMKITVSGQTQNRYYLVRSLDQKEAAAETHLQIFTEGLTAKVIASTAEPITSVRCYDTAGRLIHSATPQTSEYSFTLPTAGIYIINAETDNDRKTVKLMAK